MSKPNEFSLDELVAKAAEFDLILERGRAMRVLGEAMVNDTIDDYVSTKKKIDTLIYRMIKAAKENLK